MQISPLYLNLFSQRNNPQLMKNEVPFLMDEMEEQEITPATDGQERISVFR